MQVFPGRTAVWGLVVVCAGSGASAASPATSDVTPPSPTRRTEIVRMWRDLNAVPLPATEPTLAASDSAGHRLDLRSDLLVDTLADRRTPNGVNTEIDQTSFSGYQEQMDQMAALWNQEYDRLRLRVLASDHVPLAGGEAIRTPDAETSVRGVVAVGAASVPAPGAAGVLAVGMGFALSRKRRER